MKIKDVFLILVLWKILILIILFISIQILPPQSNFLGGGLSNYLSKPYFWAWANFDGEHYLSIAREGYLSLTYFFFPLYPLMIRLLGDIFNGGTEAFVSSGIVISYLSLFLGLIGFAKLIGLDFKKKVINSAIFLILIFPTSFYFASVYTESLFFVLIVWSYYFFRTKRFIYSGLLGALSSATRIFGLALIPAFLIEIIYEYFQTKKINLKKVGVLFMVPMGIVSYMVFLKGETGDPFEFFNSISIFGDQRSTSLILFPQVFYRYLFKIIPNVNYNYFPVVFTTFLEIFSAIIVLIFSFYLFVRKMYGYFTFSFVIFLISSLAGSFSSFPRYSLSAFPIFIAISIFLSSKSNSLKYIVFLLMFLILTIALSLFVRGYWVS